MSAAASPPVARPLRDRVLWLLLGSGDWAAADEVAVAARAPLAEVQAVLAALVAERVLERQQVGAGWLFRLEGPALGRQAGRELVRMRVAVRVVGEVVAGANGAAPAAGGQFRMGLARVLPGGPGRLGVVLAELVMPGPPDAAALEALVERFVGFAQGPVPGPAVVVDEGVSR